MLACGDRGGADVVHLVALAVQPEQQRCNPRRLLLPADADDHAVRRLERLHLEHAVARAWQVRKTELLRDHPVEARRFEAVQPFLRARRIVRRRRQVEVVAEHSLQLCAALLERLLVDRLPFPEEKVEHDEVRRNLRGELADTGLRRMEPHLHRVEVEHAVAGDHDLAIQGRVRGHEVTEGSQLGEVAQQRPAVSRPEGELAAVVFEDAPETVPFRLELPAVRVRKLLH